MKIKRERSPSREDNSIRKRVRFNQGDPGE
jgi:hypothetical protein